MARPRKKNASEGAAETAMEERAAHWEKVMRERGHVPKLDDACLDIFAVSTYHHNGPGCARCGWSICWHCDRDAEKVVPPTCES